MKVSDNVVKALIDQYNFEIESGYVYLAMVHDLTEKNWAGFAHFMDLQAKEEYEHAERFQKFIEKIDGRVELKAIPEPKKEYKSVLEIFKTALEHEKEVTSRIEKIYELALKEKNYVVTDFLKWFLSEQVEEEDTVGKIVTRLERINGNWGGIYILDSQLARRQ